MAESTPTVVLPLREAGRKRLVRRCGVKAHALGRLLSQGHPVVDGWVITSDVFDAICERVLPPGHSLKNLIKLAATPEGAQRCARAFEAMVGASVDEPIRQALSDLHDELDSADGWLLRVSLAGPTEAVWRVDGGPQSVRNRQGSDGLAEGLHDLWSRCFSLASVKAYARAQLKDPSVAVIVQPSTPFVERGFLARRDRFSPWLVGTATRHPLGVNWPERIGMMVPLAGADVETLASSDLARLCERLDETTVERLLDIGARAAEHLGDRVMVTFALRKDRAGPDGVVVLAVRDQVPWSSSNEGKVWVEAAVGGVSARPPTPFSHSVLSEVGVRALGRVVERQGLELDRGWFSSFDGRPFVELDGLVDCLTELPMWGPESTAEAIGGAPAEMIQVISGRAAAEPRGGARATLKALKWAYDQLGQQERLQREQRQLQSDIAQLGGVEYALLPTDAVGTALKKASDALMRSIADWIHLLGRQHSAVRALTLWLRRRLDDLDGAVAYGLIGGTGQSHGFGLVQAVTETCRLVAGDAAFAEGLSAATFRSERHLKDGPARGLFGQLVSDYGDLCGSAFELARPRWQEDARELASMVLGIMDLDEPVDVVKRVRKARALAERRLADIEPNFDPFERRVLRQLIDHCRRCAALRAATDQNVYRALGALRRVVLDIDRRLVRFDEGTALKAPYPRVFLCPVDRLVEALESGYPDLGRVLRMREADRSTRRKRPILPPAFCGQPVRWGKGVLRGDEVGGFGVSSGVVQGRVRVVHESVPRQLEPTDILVMRSADLALSPMWAQCAGVIVERAGMAWPSAELARDMALPMVAGIAQARLRFDDGERVRLDGQRGLVTRLGHMRDDEPCPS